MHDGRHRSRPRRHRPLNRGGPPGRGAAPGHRRADHVRQDHGPGVRRRGPRGRRRHSAAVRHHGRSPAYARGHPPGRRPLRAERGALGRHHPHRHGHGEEDATGPGVAGVVRTDSRAVRRGGRQARPCRRRPPRSLGSSLRPGSYRAIVLRMQKRTNSVRLSKSPDTM